MLNNNNDCLMNTKETAIYLGVTEGTLAVWRTNKTYPIPYIKIGSHIKYRKSDLDKWIEDRTVSPTWIQQWLSPKNKFMKGLKID